MMIKRPTDGITDFGIAPAKHCNLAFCSFRSTNRLIKNIFWRDTQ